DGGWDGLTALYEVLFRCEFFNTRLAAADELNRLTEKSERERRATEQALSTLASIVHPRRAEFTDLPADDPLLAACTLVRRRLRLPIHAAPKPKEGDAPADPLTEILRASRVRSRRVVLKEAWWKQDSGPLLAYRSADNGPVAILPTTPGRFELFDTVMGSARPITADVSDALTGTADTV